MITPYNIDELLYINEELLYAAYQDAYNKAVATLMKQEIRGMSKAHMESVMADIEQIIEELRQTHYNWFLANIPDGYQLGSDLVVDKMTQRYSIAADTINKSFGSVHIDAAKALINSTFQDVAGLTRNMEDSMRQLLRDSAKEIFNPNLIIGEARRKTSRELVRNLNQKGWTVYYDDKGRYIPLKEYVNLVMDENWVGFIDKAGRAWDPMHYSKMLTRTKMAEAASVGTENRLRANGLDLVIIPTNYGTDDWCRFYENKVFSISGQTEGYPRLSDVPNGGCPMHPLCRHRQAPFIPKFESEEMINFGKSLDRRFLGLNNDVTGYADQAKLRVLERKYLSKVL
jgi:hypothetical protein